MPSFEVKYLDIPMDKTFKKYYAMDSKQVQLIGRIKDAQVSLAELLDKHVKLTILVTNFLARYRMLLSKFFYKYLGGEIKLDWS